ncbi:hypothetical protein AX16_001415 [Volvariella volvacea WC 439]|nr:hypothetical protein AX16_001415 [Volvariella volvacea WC 439]
MQELESTPSALLAKFRRACAGFDVKSSSSGHVILENLASELARNQAYRVLLGEQSGLWVDLRRLWRDLARAQLTFWDAADSDDDHAREEEENKQINLRNWLVSVAKFTRNLVAGTSSNQNLAFENEPDIRRLLHYYTSWSAMEDAESVNVARLLTQALSNLVTANDILISKLWDTYVGLPEDQMVLIRLLGSPDERTLLTTLVFTLNCIHEKQERIQKLVRTPNGIRVCVYILDNMVKLHEAEEGTSGAEAFDVGYNIICHIIESGLVPELYQAFTMPGEIITPHQTTLFKLVDSYLQSTPLSGLKLDKAPTLNIHLNLMTILTSTFFSLALYAQSTVRRSLGHDTSARPRGSQPSTASPQKAQQDKLIPAELDMMLPKACETLVLVTQCITSIALQAEEHRTGISSFVKDNPKDYFNSARSSNRSVAEHIIELLRLLDLFLPKIQFGKPVSKPGQANMPIYPNAPPDTSGFTYLKRDLVRLLGVLCFKDCGVQDSVRNCGGVEVIMNMCVIDESNPYLQEHAIFTLHNLLDNNKENQNVVDSIKLVAPIEKNGR